MQQSLQSSRRAPRWVWVAALGLLAALVTPAGTFAQTTVDIPYQKFVLKNGLTLVVHEDHKAPIVAVNVWYHVGSKNEKLGKTGFAHLFEHLMFNGSENFNDDYFKVLERIGATDLNGTTNQDRTNYFQNVPVSALDTVLWMESDRMGHLLGAIDQAKLDEQRGVVQNEKRQGDNEPYGKVEYLVQENTYPKGHPYSWTVIGSMEDLSAAALDDVKEWFKTYYGPSNATIVVAGDITAADAKARVERFFGDIPPGPPIAKHQSWVARRTGEQRQRMEDRVPQARLYKIWNTPEWGSVDDTYLDLVSGILSSGKTSRLYKRLVYDDQIATQVSAWESTAEIGSQFAIQATAKPAGDLAAVERACDEELARLLDKGPTVDELERVKTQYLAGFVRGVERIGGFGGKSDALAESQVYGGSPDAYKSRLERIRKATVADVWGAAKRWLADGVYVLEVHPFPSYAAGEAAADRKQRPVPAEPPAARFPAFTRSTLSNGLKLLVAERHAVPVVNFRLLVDAGYASDAGGLPGTARLAADMLDEGTKTRSSLEISEALARLGASLSAGSDLDTTSVGLSALKEQLDPALEIYADVILNPSFPQADFERLKRLQLAGIEREKAEPFTMALRLVPRLLYGEGHAYAGPFTGSGTPASVAKLTRDEVLRWQAAWFRPNNATLIVVGDTTVAEITARLERLFAGWKRGDVPRKNVTRVTGKPQAEVYLIDKPGAEQSVVVAAQLAPPKANPQEPVLETLNGVLGGQFIARLNMNLREEKHWSYGAWTTFVDARGQRPFFALAPVQTDKTKETVSEIRKEIKGVRGEKPITADELLTSQNGLTLTLAGQWETAGAVLASLSEIVRFGYDDHYFDSYAQRIRSVKRPDLNDAAQVLEPDRLVWVVVGDRAKVEAGLKELNLGTLRVIDADGQEVAAR